MSTGTPHRFDLIPMRGRSSLALALISLVGVVAFAWPLFVQPGGAAGGSHSADAPWLFVLLLPLLAAVVLAELTSGGMDAKSVALLGMLTAVGAALRVLSPFAAGLEPSWIVVVLGGRVFGRGFGFVLGALHIFVGALAIGAVGPWMPFQMFAAGWVGFLAGCLPGWRGRAEIATLAVYAAVAGLAYGVAMNMWFWPFVSFGPEVAFVPGDPLLENLRRYALFWATTSLGWDIPRGLLTSLAVLVMGRPVMTALRRSARRAAFGEPITFAAARDESSSTT